MTDPERLKAFEELFEKEDKEMERWTVQAFIELLKRHDTGGVYGLAIINCVPTCQAFIDGWFNLESLVEELNKEKQ